VAEHFKTNHHEHLLESSNALEILPQLIWCQEEPISDVSAVPSYHLARFAKTFVDVVIAGDGPDHLWGRQAVMIVRRHFVNSLPGHHLLKKLLISDTANRLSKYYPIRAAQRLTQYADETVESLYMKALTRVVGNTPSIKLVPKILSESLQSRWHERIDLTNLFIGDTIDDFGSLVTYDFAVDGSFGVFSKFGKVAAEQSLLVREPYMDNSLVDFINRLPEVFKVRGNPWQRFKGTAEKKYMMRHDLGRKLLPQAILSKPKAGFTPPIRQWLQEYLDPGRFSINTLLSSSIKQAGFFNTANVKNLIDECLNKSWRRSSSDPLYMLLLFAVWHRLYIDKFTAASPTATLTELLNE
jgi:asparagine synthase (glutamine-hydrolysing)